MSVKLSQNICYVGHSVSKWGGLCTSVAVRLVYMNCSVVNVEVILEHIPPIRSRNAEEIDEVILILVLVCNQPCFEHIVSFKHMSFWVSVPTCLGERFKPFCGAR